MNWFERLLTKLFELQDLTLEQDGKYMLRWVLFKRKDGRALYLHKLVGDDWSRDPHDHPRDFVSIGLWGSYIEHRYRYEEPVLYYDEMRVWTAPWFRKFPAGSTFIHRLAAGHKPCWTLVYTGPYTDRTWGFYTREGWIQYEEYFRRHTNDH